MLLWGKCVLTYLVSTHFTIVLPSRIRVKGNSKPQEKNLGLYSAPCRRKQLSNFKEKKKDSFWNNIPPGTCDPYICTVTQSLLKYHKKKKVLVIRKILKALAPQEFHGIG